MLRISIQEFYEVKCKPNSDMISITVIYLKGLKAIKHTEEINSVKHTEEIS